MRLPVSRFLMLARSITERIGEEVRGRLVEQAFGAWLTGAKLHSLPLTLAQLQGARLKPDAANAYLNAYPTWADYLTGLGLIEKDEHVR